MAIAAAPDDTPNDANPTSDEIIYQAERTLAIHRGEPVCAALARAARPGFCFEPQPCYAWILDTDFDVIPEAEILIQAGPNADVAVLALPNWPGNDTAIETSIRAAAGPQLLIVHWHPQHQHRHDGLLLAICPTVHATATYLEIHTCSDAYDFSERWPTTLRVLDTTPNRP